MITGNRKYCLRSLKALINERIYSSAVERSNMKGQRFESSYIFFRSGQKKIEDFTPRLHLATFLHLPRF